MIKNHDKSNGSKDTRFLLKILFHVLACNVFYYVIVFGTNIKNTLTDAQRKNDRLSFPVDYANYFLTNWNVAFQTVFLTMSLIYDVMKWLERHQTRVGKMLRYYRDVLFSGVVVPITMFISSMFWTVYWIDRELVFPEVYDQVVPWWFNHCVHTNIVVVLLIETVLQPRRHPTNQKLELILNTTVNVIYCIVYYCIYLFSHRWLYEIFGILTWWQVCLYQILIWSSTFVFYYLQFPINRIFHKEEAIKEKNEASVIKNEDISSGSESESNGNDLKLVRSRSPVDHSSL